MIKERAAEIVTSFVWMFCLLLIELLVVCMLQMFNLLNACSTADRIG